MRAHKYIAALALGCLLAACGATPPDPQQMEPCPSGDRLLPWVVTKDEIVISGCDRVADLVSPSAQAVRIVRGYNTAPKTAIKMSANLEIISGTGQMELSIWEPSGPTANTIARQSGMFSASIPESPSGQLQLSILGLADQGAPMKWRVSDVRIE